MLKFFLFFFKAWRNSLQFLTNEECFSSVRLIRENKSMPMDSKRNEACHKRQTKSLKVKSSKTETQILYMHEMLSKVIKIDDTYIIYLTRVLNYFQTPNNSSG